MGMGLVLYSKDQFCPHNFNMMKNQSNTEKTKVELMAVVFSLHPDVQTKVYPMVTSPIAGNVKLASSPLPESTVLPANMVDTHRLLKQCQSLLYKVYYREMGWRPNPQAHTQFEVREEEQLFCDRYDKTAIWTAMVNPSRCEVVACARLLLPTLATNFNEEKPDLDILGYSGCPSSFRDWVQAKGSHRVLEGQRFAISAEYRRLRLPYHLFHVSSLVQKMLNPDAVIVASVPMHMMKYVMAAGGTHDPKQNWTILYEKADPLGPIPIYLMENEKVASSVAAFFRDRSEKEQRQRGREQGSWYPKQLMQLIMPGVVDTKIKFEQPSWLLHFLVAAGVFGLFFYSRIGYKLVGDKVSDPIRFRCLLSRSLFILCLTNYR